MSLIANRNNTAVVIFSFNRPHYLQQVLSSLEKNNSLKDLDFYFFQDGAINKFSNRKAAQQQDIDLCIEFWNRTKLPNKNFIQYPFNVGIGITQFEAKEYIFNTLNYERCIFFEDDLIVSRYYLQTLRLLLNQFEREKNVGAVMCYGDFFRKFSKEDEERNFSTIFTGNLHLWGWATWKEKWNQIRPKFIQYYEFIENIDYRFRPTDEILEFYKKNGFSIKASSQDAAHYFAMNSSFMFSLNTRLPRAKYIGAQGEHMRPENYFQLGLDKVEIYEKEKENDLKRFEGYDPKEFLALNNTRFRM